MLSAQNKAWDTMYRYPIRKALIQSRIELKRDKSIIISERDVEFCIYSHLKKYVFRKCTVNAGVGLSAKKRQSFPDIIIIPRDDLRPVGKGSVEIKDYSRAFCVQVKLSKGSIPHSDLEEDWNKAKKLGFREQNIMIFLAQLVNSEEFASTDEKEEQDRVIEMSRIPAKYRSNIFYAKCRV